MKHASQRLFVFSSTDGLWHTHFTSNLGHNYSGHLKAIYTTLKRRIFEAREPATNAIFFCLGSPPLHKQGK
ncbi:hypothetical protein PR048_006886 [Dryococelus australis]|uniref:Uncharacterized protein n=1 Tax=Dryococelus australis TaxID=614101 RepID=A0ABQ9IC74_9NEOP|nr:hypothetical protein PR048_006886 [Dryococelus australis]